MRKMMSSMKKVTAVAMTAAMCISLTGCGGGSSKKTVVTEAVKTEAESTEETEAVSEEVTGINDSEMAGILAGTTWAGISSQQEIMVAAFDEKDAYLAIIDTDGEVTDLDGYWKADFDTFYLYANEDYSDDPTTFAFDWYTTENGEYIQLDDIVLSSEGDGSNMETTLDQMMTTASVIEYVAQGTYWIGSGDETAMIFYFEGDQAYFDLLYNENGEIQTQSIYGLWSLDYDHLTLIDDETDMSYELGWDLSEEGDSYCFELTEDDTTYYLYESAAEDVDSTLEILTSYLTAEDSVDVEADDIDLSDFLEGYVGHSVIDAFMLSGISPDFETRKYCAELLGFSNYSGTSDENLALIQLMGGTVQ